METSSENNSVEFEKLYTKLSNEFMGELQSLRKKFLIGLIIDIILFFIVFFLFFSVSALLGVVLGICFIVLTVFVIKSGKKYDLTYKTNIIGNFVKLISNKLNYEPRPANISQVQNFYDLSGFNTQPYDNFSADDYIYGYINDNVFIELYDLSISRTETDSDGHTYSVTVFNGLFLINSSLKNINSCVKITLNKTNFFKSKQKVDIDSSTFEKYFDVYSENEILTMRILTPDVLNAIVDFTNKAKMKFEITFKNDKIFFRFFTGPMFVPSVFKNPMDKKSLQSYCTILNFIKEISTLTNNVINDLEI